MQYAYIVPTYHYSSVLSREAVASLNNKYTAMTYIVPTYHYSIVIVLRIEAVASLNNKYSL